LEITRIEQRGQVTRVWVEYSGIGDELVLMASSDRHHDSMWCNRSLETKHLQTAQERGAYIIDAGDMFDAMQGKFDPRKSYGDLRPEYRVPHYYDALVDDLSEYFIPYADRFIMIGKGNHEHSVYERIGTDLISRLVGNLRQSNKLLQVGGIGGYVQFMFKTVSGGGKFSVNYAYHHGGAGGNAPVTRGAIQTARQAVYMPDADIIHNGHNHQEYALAIKRVRLSNQGRISYDLAHFVRTPGYKDDHGNENWSDVKQHSPTPQGCAWITIRAEHHKSTARPHIMVTADVV